MKHILATALICLCSSTVMAAEPEPPDIVDSFMDCSRPILDADSPERAKLLRVQSGGRAVIRELRQTYASRLAGLFWDQREGVDSRLVVRLTGEEPVETRRLTICDEPLIVEFISGQTYTKAALQKLHTDNLEWLRAKFTGLQGTYVDERTGQIVLEIYAPEASGTDVETIRREAQSRLAAPLRVKMTTGKSFNAPAILNSLPAAQ